MCGRDKGCVWQGRQKMMGKWYRNIIWGVLWGLLIAGVMVLVVYGDEIGTCYMEQLMGNMDSQLQQILR